MREPARYLENAKEILRKSQIEGNIYLDVKYVKSACGIAYLGVLKAMDEYLLAKGLAKNELPKSAEAYTNALRKYGSIHNGKLFREFDVLYDLLHIAGYYRGLLRDTVAVKHALKLAEVFVQKLK